MTRVTANIKPDDDRWPEIDKVMVQHWPIKGFRLTQGIIDNKTGLFLSENKLRARARRLKLTILPGTTARSRRASMELRKAPKAIVCDAAVKKYYAKYGIDRVMKETGFTRCFVFNRAKFLRIKMGKKARAVAQDEKNHRMKTDKTKEKWPVLEGVDRLALVGKWRDRERDNYFVMEV